MIVNEPSPNGHGYYLSTNKKCPYEHKNANRPIDSYKKSGNGTNSSRYWTTCSKFGLASGTLSTDRDERRFSTQFVITSFEYSFLSPTLTIYGTLSSLLFLCLEEDFILNIDFTKTSFPDGLGAF